MNRALQVNLPSRDTNNRGIFGGEGTFWKNFLKEQAGLKDNPGAEQVVYRCTAFIACSG